MSSASITVTGLTQLDAQFQVLGKQADEVIGKAVGDAFKPIEQKMKQNAKDMFNKGYSTGIMQQSISTNVEVREGYVGASVGVFDMSNKTGKYPKISGRHLTAPVIAMFYETGIKPHYTVKGTRTERRETALSRKRNAKFSAQYFEQNKKRVESGKGELEPHRGSPPIPFLSQAWDSMSVQQLEAMQAAIDAAVLEII